MQHKPKREADGVTHSKPGSVEQQSEDSFPTSDPPSFSPGAAGAPKKSRHPHKHKPAEHDHDGHDREDP
ncbi:MAG: hypothetical protein KGJ78_10265 [Alphaproteobacteria bacterium]|nr:hypothetical protein [Alphaproteobacteria bacterium]